MLPLRPAPFPDESLFGYLVRLSAAHGFDGPRALWQALGSPIGAGFVAKVAEAVDVPVGVIEELQGPAPSCFRLSSCAGSATALWNHRHLRWCALCLHERAYLRRPWHLKAVTACPQHRRRLVDLCPSCGRRVAIFQLGELRCNCGAALAAAAAGGESTELELALARAADRWLEQNDEPPAFEMLNRLVVFLGQFRSAAFPQKPGKLNGLDRLDVASELVTSADRLLSNWPRHFEELLTERLAHVRTVSFTARLPEAFGTLYRVLYKRLAGEDYKFLRDAFEAFLRERWWGLLCKRNARLDTATIAEHSRVSRREAQAQTGVPKSQLKRLVHSKAICADVVDTDAGRQLTLLDRHELPRITALARKTLTLERAVQRLGLPKKLVRQMIEHELVSMIAGRVAAGRGALMISVDLPSVPVGAVDTPARSLKFLLRYSRLFDEERIGLLHAVLNGELRDATRVPEDGLPLGEARLSQAAFRCWLTSVRAAQPDRGLTVRQAAVRLGIKEEVAYHLVRTGLLISTSPSRCVLISPENLDRFRTTYVALAELAHDAGRSPRSFMANLEAQPVCGPTINGCRQYFYRRDALNSQPVRVLSPLNAA